MTEPLNNYASTSANWRLSLRANNRKTYFVIGLFFLIYFALGLLVDTTLIANQYPGAPISQILQALLHFQVLPLATLVMLGVAGISLLITFSLHDKLMLLGTDYHEITADSAKTIEEKQLYNVVEEMKIAAGLHYMPKVYIIEADYMNAFASGYSEKSAMVAITAGLIQKLTRDELQAVMAHEISHIRHMDIKLTLMASVLANLMLIVLDIFFYSALYSRNNSEGRSKNSLNGVIILLRYLLPIINILLLLYLSRTREFMADAGCVELMRDNQALARALLKIQQDYTQHATSYNDSYQSTPHENVRREAYIFDPTQAGFGTSASLSNLFSTHPSISDRLAALGFQNKQK